MAARKTRHSRLARLIQQCENAIARAWPDFYKRRAPRICQCPACAARGSSVVDDDGGRFLSCLVCGSSVPCSALDT
jgi:transcription elongation factor Elf1